MYLDKKCNKHGITIIEVVVALLCFGIAIAALATLSYTVKQSADLARDHYVASNLAKNRIERMKTFDFDQLDIFNENRVRVNVNGVPDANGMFRRSTTVTDAGPGLVEVLVVCDVFNRVSMQFDPGYESVRSYIADIMVPDDQE